jgi:hypothetical protein
VILGAKQLVASALNWRRSPSENSPFVAWHKAGLPAVALHRMVQGVVRSMGAGGAKLYWPSDQFLRC